VVVAAVGVVSIASSESTAVVLVAVVVIARRVAEAFTKRPPGPLTLPFRPVLPGRRRPCESLVGALVGVVMVEALVAVVVVEVPVAGDLSEVSVTGDGFMRSALSSGGGTRKLGPYG